MSSGSTFRETLEQKIASAEIFVLSFISKTVFSGFNFRLSRDSRGRGKAETLILSINQPLPGPLPLLCNLNLIKRLQVSGGRFKEWKKLKISVGP